ncbi:hypothetical protein D3H35_05860 [Cohnella faecalis]|uniref:Uncharacterized protein n=1 Tax=Cohnella faecalis TaxID=2315694 RepID=A0A398CY49_9BACL|nr:hypothetical protein D3H35_05860 [Cohnella faecalis]
MSDAEGTHRLWRPKRGRLSRGTRSEQNRSVFAGAANERDQIIGHARVEMYGGRQPLNLGDVLDGGDGLNVVAGAAGPGLHDQPFFGCDVGIAKLDFH